MWYNTRIKVIFTKFNNYYLNKKKNQNLAEKENNKFKDKL